MASVDAIIERLGGAERAAQLTGVGLEAIRKWRQSRAIPSRHWPAIVKATGLTMDDLHQPDAALPPSIPPTSGSLASASLESSMSATADLSDVPDGATALLVLADGSLHWGRGIGARTTDAESGLGEICFSTGLTGYQETLTDASFAGQIITFTFPHVGNVGTNPDDMEAVNVAARGLVVKQDLTEPSNWRSAQPLEAWLVSRNIPGISGVDTRALTLRIRDGGPQTGLIAYPADGRFDIAALRARVAAWPGLEGMDLAKAVSCTQSYRWQSERFAWAPQPERQGAPKKVVAVDYGAKQNILRSLASAGCDVTVVPATATAEDILRHQPDGVFLSNGPGDPAATGAYAVPAIQGVLASDTPVFGICLGHQLLALALGARTYKLDRGHRGANQPVKELATGKVEITSQNHGFAVDDKSLPEDVKVTHVSLFDGSNEGIASTKHAAFSVQYHPEASPGPSDSTHLFDRFVALMEQHRR
jgi:carbamoyl-phosphate synthase small subunit